MILKSFFRDRSGNVAIILALAMMPLLGAVGAAVDYSRLFHVRSAMQNHLDIAVLAAVQEANETDAKVRFSGFFSSGFRPNESEVHNVSAKVERFDITELEGVATADVDMTFMHIFGIETMPVGVRATAARKTGFQELVFAVDLSGSLGMGATPEDRTALEALTRPYTANELAPKKSWYAASLPQGCAFACHRRESWEPGKKTVYEMARDAGIKVREDELNVQFDGLTDLLLDPRDELVQQGKRKVTVVAFSNNAKKLIERATLRSAVNGILDSFPYSERFETVFSSAFTTIGSVLGTQGSGTQDSPAKMLILITDGIESADATNVQKPIDTKLCAGIKAKGFPVAVVELKYPKLSKNYLYDATVKPVENKISPAMEACASPGWYFQAIMNDTVPDKFKELKAKFGLTNIRLTK